MFDVFFLDLIEIRLIDMLIRTNLREVVKLDPVDYSFRSFAAVLIIGVFVLFEAGESRDASVHVIIIKNSCYIAFISFTRPSVVIGGITHLLYVEWKSNWFC